MSKFKVGDRIQWAADDQATVLSVGASTYFLAHEDGGEDCWLIDQIDHECTLVVPDPKPVHTWRMGGEVRINCWPDGSVTWEAVP